MCSRTLFEDIDVFPKIFHYVLFLLHRANRPWSICYVRGEGDYYSKKVKKQESNSCLQSFKIPRFLECSHHSSSSAYPTYYPKTNNFKDKRKWRQTDTLDFGRALFWDMKSENRRNSRWFRESESNIPSRAWKWGKLQSTSWYMAGYKGDRLPAEGASRQRSQCFFWIQKSREIVEKRLGPKGHFRWKRGFLSRWRY